MLNIPAQKPLESSAPLPPLHAAARAGDLDTLTPLLQDKETLDARDADGRTALHWAAAQGHETVVRALLDAGAGLDAPNLRGETALSFAVTFGQASVVRLLLGAGANRELYRSPESEEKKPITPETEQIQKDTDAMRDRFDRNMERFIERSMTAEAAAEWRAEQEADKQKSDAELEAWRTQPQRIRLLSRAVRAGSLDILVALLEAGESPNFPNTLVSLTLLDFTISIGSQEMIKALLQHGADPNANNPLFSVVASGNLERARLLLEAGADPNRKTKDTEYPVMMALITGNPAMLDLLMEFGGQLDNPDESSASSGQFLKGNTALRDAVRRRQHTEWMDAVESGDLNEVRTALDQGADINALREDKQTALLLAVKRDDNALIRLLLERGANVNLPGEYGATPLYKAVSESTIDIVGLLLDAGADPNQSVSKEWTPLQRAGQQQKWEVADLLEAHGAIIYPSDLALREDTARLQQRWEAGTPVDTPSPAGMTALVGAVVRGNRLLIEDLLARGANVNVQDSSGNTPLHYAMQRDDTDTFTYLLGRGAVPTIKAETGHSLLHDALFPGKLDVARLLLKAGAPIGYEGAQLRQHLMHDALLYDRIQEQLSTNGVRESSGPVPPPAPERMRVLLDFGGDINAVSYDGETLLTAAIKEKAKASLALLLERDPDIHLPNDNDETPMIAALKARDGETAQVLVQKGADINYDWQGLLPLDIAERTLPEMANWLRERGARKSDVPEEGSISAQAHQICLDMLTADNSVPSLMEKTSSLFSRQD